MEREKLLEAGRIAAEVRELARRMVKPKAKLLDVAEAIEAKIRELGGEAAFPVNLSINEIAAHYTPERDEETRFREGDMVKVDIGVHVDGYIGDTATTIYLGDDEKLNRLLECTERALEAAIAKIRPGVEVKELSQAIQQTIESYGFKPVRNLTGHGLDRFNLHAKPEIPNVVVPYNYVLRQGDVIAIEPFASTGEGVVHELDRVNIFAALKEEVRTRFYEARYILKAVAPRNGLPFATRWLSLDKVKLLIGLRELRRLDAIYEYPVLADRKGSFVAQTEHTVIVDDPPIITTQLEQNIKD